MKDVILVSAGIFHPPWLGRRRLRAVLTRMPDIRWRHLRSLNKLTAPVLETAQALVLYFHHRKISAAALTFFAEYVERGGGVLALHSATASFKGAEAYGAILGGRFRGHGPVAPLRVKPVSAADEIFGEIPPFTIRDELYLHERQPPGRVHFVAQGVGEKDKRSQQTPEPLVWTRQVGDGRVCYVGPGHRSATLSQPPVQTIIRRGIRWVCGE